MAGELSRYLAKIGAKGGAKSRRVLTPEQAKAMVKARELKRSERAAGAGVGKKARRTSEVIHRTKNDKTMTPALLSKLARLQNHSTRYEVTATNGGQTVLAGYTRRKGRAGVSGVVRMNAEKWVAFTGADSITFGKKAADGARIGAWSIRFSGRTQRDAYLAGELPFFADLIAQPIAA